MSRVVPALFSVFVMWMAVGGASRPALAESRVTKQGAVVDARRDAAMAVVADLGQRCANVEATWQPQQPGPSVVAGLCVHVEGSNEEQKARRFLADFSALVPVPGAELVLDRIDASRGRRVVRFDHRWRGLPIFDRQVAVTLDDSGRVLALASDIVPVGKLAMGKVSHDAAKTVALRTALELPATQPLPKHRARSVEGIEVGLSGIRHVFRVEVVRVPLADHERVVVDAVTGDVLSRKPRLRH